MEPRIVSAGHVAHHPTTAADRSLSDRMFQSALTWRIRLVTGSCSPAALTATKWPMWWASGVLPVAIVVQITGERRGFCESSCA